jgi:hypothetical protein
LTDLSVISVARGLHPLWQTVCDRETEPDCLRIWKRQPILMTISKRGRHEIFSRNFQSRLRHSFSCTFPTLEAHAPGSITTFRRSDTETATQAHGCLGMTAHYPDPQNNAPRLYRIRIQDSLCSRVTRFFTPHVNRQNVLTERLSLMSTRRFLQQ